MSVAAILLSVVSLFIMSFTVSEKITQDFLKQLGISKTDADRKINDGFLGLPGCLRKVTLKILHWETVLL